MKTIGILVNVCPTKTRPIRVGVVSARNNSFVVAVESDRINQLTYFVKQFLMKKLSELLTIQFVPTPGAETPRYYLLIIACDPSYVNWKIQEITILGVKVDQIDKIRYRIYDLTKWGIEVTKDCVRLLGYWNKKASIELLRSL